MLEPVKVSRASTAASVLGYSGSLEITLLSPQFSLKLVVVAAA